MLLNVNGCICVRVHDLAPSSSEFSQRDPLKLPPRGEAAELSKGRRGVAAGFGVVHSVETRQPSREDDLLRI